MKEAFLYEKLEADSVLCKLCAHNCKIQEGNFGICGVRQNKDGILYSIVFGKPIALNVDPIEKKPLYHLLPGSSSYSLATAGCNFKCDFCQNWQISQVGKRGYTNVSTDELSPEEIVHQAISYKCNSISYTYTEPTIFFEYAYEIGKIAKEKGIYNVFVTNGYMSIESLDMLKGILDAANVDLKSFREEFYRKNCKAHLNGVLRSIRHMKKLGIWVEVTTLIIPGENDSDEELIDIAEFLVSIGKEIPWHISRFHPDYEMNDKPPTPLRTMKRAMEIGLNAGLRYVYMGNVSPGDAGENTICYRCKKTVINRFGFNISGNNIVDSKCKVCNVTIDGIGL